MHWSEQRYDLSEKTLNSVCKPAYGVLFSQALELRGWIAVSREQYESATAFFSQALNVNRKLDQPDTFVEAKVMLALAVFARELCQRSLIEQLRYFTEFEQWPADLALEKCHILRQLGWCEALSGNYIKAFSYLRKSADCAPEPAWHVLSLVDRAYLAKGLKELYSAEDLLDHAMEQAELIDWSSTNGEQRVTLLLLAELCAAKFPDIASKYLYSYIGIKEKMSSMLAFRHDRRLKALEQYSAGVVYKALGKIVEARTSLREAFEIWRDIGYKPRAALAAVAYGPLTMQQEHVFDAARLLLKEMPGSWLAAALTPDLKIHSDDVGKTLTKSQREVLRYVCRGLPTKEIAVRRDTTEFTARNTLIELFDAFGLKTRTRAALVAECARRGIA